MPFSPPPPRLLTKMISTSNGATATSGVSDSRAGLARNTTPSSPDGIVRTLTNALPAVLSTPPAQPGNWLAATVPVIPSARCPYKAPPSSAMPGKRLSSIAIPTGFSAMPNSRLSTGPSPAPALMAPQPSPPSAPPSSLPSLPSPSEHASTRVKRREVVRRE